MPLLSSADCDAIILSLKVALTATLISLPLGFLYAYLMTFFRFRAKVLLEVLVNLPLTLPPVVMGYLLLVSLGRNGWLAPLLDLFGVRLIFTWKAAVLASAIVGFPLLVRSIRIAMEGIDGRLVQASRTLGAGPVDTLLSVILPLSVSGVVSGASLMFARSLGEFGATIIVAGNMPGSTQTIPLAIYDYASSPGGERAALYLCAVAVGISVFVLGGHEALVKRLARRT